MASKINLSYMQSCPILNRPIEYLNGRCIKWLEITWQVYTCLDNLLTSWLSIAPRRFKSSWLLLLMRERGLKGKCTRLIKSWLKQLNSTYSQTSVPLHLLPQKWTSEITLMKTLNEQQCHINWSVQHNVGWLVDPPCFNFAQAS